MSDWILYAVLFMSVFTPLITAAFMYACWKGKADIMVKDLLLIVAVIPILNILIFGGLLFAIFLQCADDIVFRGRE